MDQALDLPFGQLLDLITIEQIKHEGAKYRPPETEGDFWELMTWR